MSSRSIVESILSTCRISSGATDHEINLFSNDIGVIHAELPSINLNTDVCTSENTPDTANPTTLFILPSDYTEPINATVASADPLLQSIEPSAPTPLDVETTDSSVPLQVPQDPVQECERMLQEMSDMHITCVEPVQSEVDLSPDSQASVSELATVVPEVAAVVIAVPIPEVAVVAIDAPLPVVVPEVAVVAIAAPVPVAVPAVAVVAIAAPVPVAVPAVAVVAIAAPVPVAVPAVAVVAIAAPVPVAVPAVAVVAIAAPVPVAVPAVAVVAIAAPVPVAVPAVAVVPVATPVAVPAVATLAPPITIEIPVAVPAVATLAPPITIEIPVPVPAAATLAPTVTLEVPLPVPAAATLTPTVTPTVTLAVPTPVTLAPIVNTAVPLEEIDIKSLIRASSSPSTATDATVPKPMHMQGPSFPIAGVSSKKKDHSSDKVPGQGAVNCVNTVYTGLHRRAEASLVSNLYVFLAELEPTDDVRQCIEYLSCHKPPSLADVMVTQFIINKGVLMKQHDNEVADITNAV
jgi:hypothetical protein